MASTQDVFDSFEPLIAMRPVGNPWTTGADGSRVFAPDHELLEQLVAVPIGAGAPRTTLEIAAGLCA